ncbi:MAG: GAF domain-containing protein, partial [Anaerolineales bacterium]|nr:GAF domain-containing protein [Anaerolineales bacterium]
AVQDVTERVLSENSLHESNERFRQLVRKLNAVVWSASLDGSKLMDYNQSFERIYGSSVQEFESNPDLWLELVHPEDRKIAEESTEKLFKDGETSAEYRIIRPDGSVRWILDQTSLLLDKEGKPIQMGGIATDITEQKHVIAEIRQQTSFAEALATSASIINSNLDLDSMLNAICKETAQALSAPSVVLRLYDQESQTLQIAADYGLPAEFRKRMAPIHLDPNQSELSLGPDSPVIIPDIQSVPDHPDADLNRSMDLRTVVVTKILAKGKLIGSLTVISLGKERLFSDDEINLLKRLSDQAAQAITNVRYLEDIEHQLNKIKSLHLIDSVIANSTDIRLTLKVIIEEVIRQLGVDAVSVLLYNPDSKSLEYANGQGFRTSQNQKRVEQPGEGLLGSAVQGRQMIHIPNLADIGDEFSLNPLFDDEGFVAYYGMPLIAKGQVIGVMEIFHRASLNPNNEWLNFLETLAGQTAIAIDSAQSFENLQRSNEKLVVAYDATIEGWSRAMDLRDHETEGHSRRVAQLTLQLAQEMGISDEEMVHMRRGALLHDIGKLGVPDSILLKPSKLTEAEWKVMRQHPQFAYDMLSSIEYLRPAVDIPYYHHEKWDGSGYPQGLAGEQIPLAARIFAVVDVWDALTSDRPYRPAFSKEKALEYMREQPGRHFDADILRKFLELLSTQTTHGDD